ncbi:MAG: amino acid permease [Acidobacteria bacterium]|nr:amino acid permease [Acidobacteriota bacterium]
MTQPTNDTGLVRGIRRWDLVAVAINGIIGAGIFGLPSKVFALIGAYSIVAFIACALVVALVILCFAEVGSRFKDSGGPYLYTRQAFGSVAGFQVGWLMWLARLTAFAANLNLFVDYLSYFLPTSTTPVWRNTIIIAVVLLLTTVNVLGVRDTTRLSNLFTVGKLLPMILFIAVGIFFISPQNFSFAAPLAYKTFSASVLTMVYAFSGFEMAVIPAGEVQDPQRNQPMALITAIVVVAVLYISIQVVCIGTLPELATSTKPVADAGSKFLGRAGGALITAGVLVSIIGNLNVLILAASRLVFAMGERGELPQVVAATHKKFRTPHIAILATTTVMLTFTLWSTFLKQVNLSVIARLLAYAATCAALMMLRRKPDAPAAMFKTPAGLAVSIFTLVLIAWLLSNATWQDARDSAIAAALGLVIYFAYQWPRRNDHTPEKSQSV